jgi:hypothetical protein
MSHLRVSVTASMAAALSPEAFEPDEPALER